MTTIINTTDLQKNVWTVSREIYKKNFIVTNKWRWRLRILPYFDWSDKYLEEYFENLEIFLNREKLKNQMEESKNSWKSNLVKKKFIDEAEVKYWDNVEKSLLNNNWEYFSLNSDWEKITEKILEEKLWK